MGSTPIRPTTNHIPATNNNKQKERFFQVRMYLLSSLRDNKVVACGIFTSETLAFDCAYSTIQSILKRYQSEEIDQYIKNRSDKSIPRRNRWDEQKEFRAKSVYLPKIVDFFSASKEMKDWKEYFAFHQKLATETKNPLLLWELLRDMKEFLVNLKITEIEANEAKENVVYDIPEQDDYY